MKILLLACVALAGCAAQEARRTGVVGPDGQIVWDEPGELYGVPQSNPAQEIAQGVSDFARGYAQGAEQYQAEHPYQAPQPIQIQQQQHGTATVFTPGATHPLSLINY
jgi:hypothetical protein